MKRNIKLILLGGNLLYFLLVGCNLVGNLEDSSDSATIVLPQAYKGRLGDNVVVKEVTDFSNFDFENNTGKVFLIKQNISNRTVDKKQTGSLNTENASRSIMKNYETATVDFSSLTQENSEEILEAHFNEVEQYETSRSIFQGNSLGKKRKFSDLTLNQNESFNIIKNLDSKFYTFEKMNAELKAIGENCLVWLVTDKEFSSSAYTEITEDDCSKVAEIFDSIYKKETEVFGSNKFSTDNSNYFSFDEDSDKVSIVLLDINQDTSKIKSGAAKSSTFGFFYSNDMKLNMKSNKTEIIYIDDYLLKASTKKTYSTLAHEFQHLLAYINKTILQNLQMDTWTNEMLSMIAEDYVADILNINSSYYYIYSPVSRLNYYNQYSNFGFSKWNFGLKSYANAYAFGAFISRNYGGVELIKEICSNSYTNMESVTKAISKLMKLPQEISQEQLLSEFAQSSIFIDSETPNGRFSLNKTSNDGQFAPINLNSKNLKGLKVNDSTIYGPIVYSPEECGQTDLYPYAKSVHFLGTNLDTVSFNAPESESIKYYLVYEVE